MYQNQPQFSPSQAFLANNENFNIVNYSRNNLAHQHKTMPGCTCCNINQYPSNTYFYPRQLKPKQEERNMINKRQMNSNSNDSDDKKFNNPPSRLEKAKQFVRKVESESLTSPTSSDLSTNQSQNQFYPVDVLYTLLPMYLSPILNRQAYQNQQPIDSAYIQNLVSFFLNMNQQMQPKTLVNNNNQQSNNTLNNNQTKNGTKKTNRSRILIQDIDSKVEEHFKRSLGNDYVNLMSDSKRIKLDNGNNLAKETVHPSSHPSSPSSSIKTVSSCASPTFNLNEHNQSDVFQKSPEFVENHFSKALGVDTWNRLKEKIRNGSDGSDGSSTVSSMSDTSISPVKL